MKTRKFFYLAAFMFVVALNQSCDKESTESANELYDTQGIDKKELDNSDT